MSYAQPTEIHSLGGGREQTLAFSVAHPGTCAGEVGSSLFQASLGRTLPQRLLALDAGVYV